MAIGVMDFPLLTPQQTNPASGTLGDIVAKRLAMAKMQGEENKAPYSGLAELSKIRSQTAYSDAVTPQLQAKLLGNKLILPSIKNPQERANAILAMGNNIPGNNRLSSSIQTQLANIYNQQSSRKSLLDTLGEHITGMLGGEPQEQFPMAQQIAQQQPQGMPQQQPQMGPPMPQQMPQQQMGAPQMPFAQQTGAGGYGRTPENIQHGNNIADFNRQIEKGTAQGNEEGKQQAQYGEQAAGVVEQEKALKNLNKIFQNPALKQIADVPFVNQKSVGFYKNAGTPQQKAALGEMDSAMKGYIASSLKMFGSRVTNNDLMFLNQMKPNDNDTLDVRRGKLVALETLADAKKAQIKLANGLMAQGLPKADAELFADQQIDMDQVRAQAMQNVFPPNVKVMTPRGIIELPPEGAKQLLKDHPEMHKVVG